MNKDDKLAEVIQKGIMTIAEAGLNKIKEFAEKETYEKLWKMNGKDKQFQKGIEEFSELITEISRILSGRNKPISEEFISEVADCQIILNQFKSQLSINQAVADEMERKIQRLNQRIKEEKLEK